jgi:hypothetical protein
MVCVATRASDADLRDCEAVGMRTRLYCHLVAWTTAQDVWLRAQWGLSPWEADAVQVLRRHWQCVYRE